MQAKSNNNEIEYHTAASLEVHPTAQREIVPSNLARIVAEFDIDAVGTLHAVRYNRNGKFGTWLVDGQTRRQAAIEAKFGDRSIPVEIHKEVKNDAQASRLFLKLNNFAKPSPYDKFKQEVNGEIPVAIGVTNIVNNHGLRITDQTGDGKLSCVTTLKKIYSIDNGVVLNDTIHTIKATWGTRASALEGVVIDGLSIIHKRFNGRLDRTVLIHKLQKSGTASALVGRARSLRAIKKGSLAKCLAETAMIDYNSGKSKNKIEDPL